MAGDIVFGPKPFCADQTTVIQERSHTLRQRLDSYALNSGVHKGEYVSAYLKRMSICWHSGCELQLAGPP